MHKFILIPDSFKGTLSSARICELISDKINKIFNESEIVSLPVADGGADGDMDGDMTELYAAGVTAVFPINRLPQDFSVSRRYSEENLSRTAEDVLRLLKVLSR